MHEIEFLKSFPALNGTPESVLQEFLSASHRQSVPPDTHLHYEGDECSAIAFVLSGSIRIYKLGHGGREITLYEIGAGDTCILNASCIISRSAYPANAVTLSETELILVPSKNFEQMMAQSERMRNFIFGIMNRLLAAVMELVEDVAFGRLDQRLLDYIKQKSANGQLEITHQKIANDIGTSREVVSRLLKDLERKQLIKTSRNSITLLK